MNIYGEKKEPFLFLIDFEMERPVLFPLNNIDPKILLYNINGKTNSPQNKTDKRNLVLKKFPMLYEEYFESYKIVQKALKEGYTYCTNLTGRTPVSIDCELREIFFLSNEKYKIWYKNEFVCFSPEKFITIKNGLITACPMKGTIDASVPGAAEIIINNIKEKAEHDTIVDLLRNDLSIVAKNVKVTNYRYIEEINSGEKKLLQVSSEITGEVTGDFYSKTGDIIFALLPAGSISGAPKKATVDVIKKAEKIPRGYYTGICGIFDGESLDCGVMIRFIENDGGKYYYRSGGGITAMSSAEEEYNELINKVYVPFN